MMQELGLESWWGQKAPSFVGRVLVQPPDWDEEKESLIISARLDGVTVARCDCDLLEGTKALRINKLEVHDIFEARKFQPLGRLRQRSKRGMRGLGIGKKVLEATVEAARIAGARSVFGFIVQDDLKARRWLREFYEKHHFTISPASDADYPGAVMRIEKRIP